MREREREREHWPLEIEVVDAGESTADHLNPRSNPPLSVAMPITVNHGYVVVDSG